MMIPLIAVTILFSLRANDVVPVNAFVSPLPATRCAPSYLNFGCHLYNSNSDNANENDNNDANKRSRKQQQRMENVRAVQSIFYS